MTKLKTFLALVALVLIAFLSNWLVSILPIGNRGIDLTEDKIHTISEGTKSILRELDAPVTINYYVTRKSNYLPEHLKLYIKRVDSVLKQYESLADGKLRLIYHDPQPDTDAEDAANLDGISGQRINEDNVYFGLSVQCLDQKSTIPFLNPNEETLLEYHLSSAIAEVSQKQKPVIGLISPIPIAGTGMPSFPGQPPQPQPWLIHEQLSQQYEMRDLGFNPGPIDSETISAILVVHPADISPEAEYHIDQYLLKGGTVIAALDAYSVIASQTMAPADPTNPAASPSALPVASDLPTLLPNWGVTFHHKEVLADSKYRTKLNQGLAVSILSLPQEAIKHGDEIATIGINDLFIPLPGAFTTEPREGLTTTELITSSAEAAFVDAKRAIRLDSQLALEMEPTGEQYPLMLRITGNFPTSFPDGYPGDRPEGIEDASLATASAPGTVFLLADSDFFHDQFGYRVQNVLGTRMATPQASNTALLQNIIDLSAGSRHLIDSRSRVPSRRPFTVIKEMDAEFEQKMGKKVVELQEKQQKVIERITQIQATKQNSNSLLLSPDQQSELATLKAQEVDFRRQLRELQKDLQTEKNALSSKITLANIAIMPGLVLLLGLVIYLRRKSTTRAK